MNSEVPLNPRIIQVIQRQIVEIIKTPPDCVNYILNERDILDIQADVSGPVGTPYFGGFFRCKLVLSSEFPKVPPKGYFLTKIFHPNVSEKGEICVNTLKKDWNPSNWSLSSIFEVIRCLLIVPFPESALNDEAGKLFMDDYEEYAKHAKLITELYAMPKDTQIQMKLNSPRKESQPDLQIQNFSPMKSTFSMNNTVIEETQFTKENQSSENPFIGIKQFEKTNSFPISSINSNTDEVLTTVTNSIKTNIGSLNVEYKKSNSENLNANSGSTAGGITPVSNTTMQGSNSLSAKKENDKKIWRKRI